MGPGPLCGPALAKLVEGAGAGAARGAAEQQRADHGPSRRDTRDDTV